jgi:farnesyl-diphosphate farnesyltransferase
MNPAAAISDQALQGYMLQGVSRTFALTIPQLPERLARVVANGYLLCRIVDTIEDEVALSAGEKRRFCEQFVRVVAGDVSPEIFSEGLYPLLSERSLAAERELILNTPRVIEVTRSFSVTQQEALECCVRVMAGGMAEFQENNGPHGLGRLTQMDRYCYHVAGVVGEMLTKLFCDYSTEIAAHRDALLALAVSFGQGLQMTNILKDLWDDRGRGVCWLPQDVFAEAGFDLRELSPGRYEESFGLGLARLIGVAHGHLQNALAYTLLIPRRETGIRNFCLWAIGMAVLTLRKIHKHPSFTTGSEVKISRRSVKATIILARLSAGSDSALRILFYLAGRGLPAVHVSRGRSTSADRGGVMHRKVRGA